MPGSQWFPDKFIFTHTCKFKNKNPLSFLITSQLTEQNNGEPLATHFLEICKYQTTELD